MGKPSGSKFIATRGTHAAPRRMLDILVYRDGAEAIEEGFTAEDLPELLADEDSVVWLDFNAQTDEEVKTAEKILVDVFEFHYLTVEDCRETRNQPKVEAYKNYLYFILHGVKTETNSTNFVTKELDGYLGPNFIVTYHHESFRSIDRVKQLVRSNTFSCQRGAAYLLHQIFDQLVDLYMPVIDDFDNTINALEERVFLMQKSNNVVLEDIMNLRRAVARLKRISSRQLEVLYRISHGEFHHIPEQILPFFRDVHDHLLRVSDLSENYRDLVSGLFEIHFAVIANRTNDVMKVMTLISTIMLPLSLIAGIYGMNFENMPELKSAYGYYVALAAMLLVAFGFLYYFWRKGWLFDSNPDDPSNE